MSTVYINNKQGDLIGNIFTATYNDSYIKRSSHVDSATVATYDSKLGFTTNVLTNECRKGDTTLAMLKEYDIYKSYSREVTSSAAAYSTVNTHAVISYAGSFSLRAFLGYCLVGVGIAYFVSSDVHHMLRPFVGFIGKFL